MVSAIYDFPARLQALQLQLHRVRSQYEQLCRALPWSVEPSSGRTYERSLMGSLTKTVTFEDSPGCTAEEISLVRSLRERLVRLSAAVITDPWWATVPAGKRADARMTLNRLNPQPEREGSGQSTMEKAA